MESYKIIQDNLLTSGDFDRNGVIKALKDIPYEDFNRFCREIMHLDHYYYSTHGASVCDMLDFIAEHQDKFWKLPDIDPDEQIHFRIKE